MKQLKNLNLIFLIIFLSSCQPAFLLKEQSKSLSDFSYTTWVLPEKIDEISGLEYVVDGFYGFNDSGGEPEIYKFITRDKAEIVQTIQLSNAKNVDWEEMALSEQHIFVGDFGNNRGKREDLKVYYFPKSTLNQNSIQEVKVDSIDFFYPEQESFDVQLHNHDFDLEAMQYFDKKLHLFTKSWKTQRTKHYTLDIVQGKQPAWLVEEQDLNFMITGADIFTLNDKYSRLGLVGYTMEGDVYLLLTDFSNKNKKWLDSPKTLIHLGFAGDVGQVEGISIISQTEVCFSAESIQMEGKSTDQNLTCISLKL